MSNPEDNMSGEVVMLERIRRLLLVVIFMLTGGIAFTLYRCWPDLSKKTVDHPFGPYADGFSEKANKYGPFIEIKSAGE